MKDLTIQSALLTAAIGAGLLLAGAGATPLSAARSTPESPGEVRALWVVRTALTSPASIETMVRAAADGGFTTLLVQVRGRGEAFYRSDLEPRSADLAGQPADFDPLALAIDLGHRAGLSVHAWVNVNLVASAVRLPGSADHVVRRHPEWLMVPRPVAGRLAGREPSSAGYLDTLAAWSRNAGDVEGLYLSPLIPAAQDHTIAVLRELIERYPLDGLHLDYIRYPSADYDYNPGGLAAFRETRLPHATADERSEFDAARAKDPGAWATRLPEAWNAFRRDRLTALVQRIRATVNEARPALTVSAAVVPDAGEALHARHQDWPGWAGAGLLDAVCPMAYTPDASLFSRQLASIRALLPATPVWAGIGAWRLSAAATAARVRLAREAGADGIAIFSWDSLAAERDGGRRYLATLRPVLLAAPGAPAGRE